MTAPPLESGAGRATATAAPLLIRPRFPAGVQTAVRTRQASPLTELGCTLVGTLVTVGATIWLLAAMVTNTVAYAREGRPVTTFTAIIFDLGLLGLVVVTLVYQANRWGYHRRRAGQAAAARATADELRQLYGPRADPGLVTVLIPSYREDVRIVRQTVLSAALQDVPDRRVVICVDDPPAPATTAGVDDLAAVRELPDLLNHALREADRQVEELLLDDERSSVPETASRALGRRAELLAAAYDGVVAILTDMSAAEPEASHVDRLFRELTFDRRIAELAEQAADLRRRGHDGDLSPAELDTHGRRLRSTFRVDISTFERKLVTNLSHEPNKAMNLNAYIELVGGDWTLERRVDGIHLLSAGDRVPDLQVPASPWLLTLDADSLLRHDYARTLLAQMSHPDLVDVAVMQTPYIAVPGAKRPIERAAGATTDIMHLVHQGSSWFDAEYWVGANALLRHQALVDIRTTTTERGFEVARYIQDRTVIEDTESTIDLMDAGWRVHNHPERLAWSATPADYGSLLIQRRRWANGGLLILPKLLRSLAGSPRRWFREGIVRANYLLSIAVVNLALIVLLLVPTIQPLPVIPLVATFVPYMWLYARDLRANGRQLRDLFEVYALNLLLIPVNLGGVLKSVQQGLSRRRIPFGRTPKIAERTAAPAGYVWATLGLLALWLLGTGLNLVQQHWTHAFVRFVHGLILAYAIGRFAGWRAFLGDGFRRR